MRYQDIVFIQGEEALEPLDVLDRDGPDAAVTYLLQWDQGDGDTCDGPPWGSDDCLWRADGLVLAWSGSLGYIGLHRELP